MFLINYTLIIIFVKLKSSYKCCYSPHIHKGKQQEQKAGKDSINAFIENLRIQEIILKVLMKLYGRQTLGTVPNVIIASIIRQGAF